MSKIEAMLCHIRMRVSICPDSILKEGKRAAYSWHGSFHHAVMPFVVIWLLRKMVLTLVTLNNWYSDACACNL